MKTKAILLALAVFAFTAIQAAASPMPVSLMWDVGAIKQQLFCKFKTSLWSDC